MKVENLLNAAVELEKRIAADRRLRSYFSRIWSSEPATRPKSNHTGSQSSRAQKNSEITVRLSPEMYKWLEVAVTATGKTPAQLLEESLAEYCAKNAEKWKIQP